jgi:ATP-dependent protease ClpP protease subunit
MNLLKRKSDDMYQGKKKTKLISIKDSNSDTSSDDDKTNSDKASKSNEVDLISRSNNHIYFHKEVNKKTICKLVRLIREAEEECYLFAFLWNIPEIPIYLHINSMGGSIFAAFSAIDVIKSCRVPIHTIIEGATASAGTLISIVGKKRYITPTSYMLINSNV